MSELAAPLWTGSADLRVLQVRRRTGRRSGGGVATGGLEPGLLPAAVAGVAAAHRPVQWLRPSAPTGGRGGEQTPPLRLVDAELAKLDAFAGRLAMETGQFWRQAPEVNRQASVDRQWLCDLDHLERMLVDAGLCREKHRGSSVAPSSRSI